MNDRFKFRAWDKKNKKMHYNDFIVTATGFIGKIKKESGGRCEFNQEDMTTDNTCNLMQSTGLKDKNGKLIYGGDIVKENWHTYVIGYCGSGYWIEDIKNTHCFTLSALCNEKAEVIGNMYENPELLEDV